MATTTLEQFKIAAGVIVHGAATTAITAPDATDEASADTLATDIEARFAEHFASVIASGGAHLTADTTTAATLATAIMGRATAASAALAAHIAGASHHAKDGANVPTRTPRHAGIAEACAVLNDVKGCFNAHAAAAVAVP